MTAFEDLFEKSQSPGNVDLSYPKFATELVSGATALWSATAAGLGAQLYIADEGAGATLPETATAVLTGAAEALPAIVPSALVAVDAASLVPTLKLYDSHPDVATQATIMTAAGGAGP